MSLLCECDDGALLEVELVIVRPLEAVYGLHESHARDARHLDTRGSVHCSERTLLHTLTSQMH